RAVGLGGVMTVWHQFVEDDLRLLLGIREGVAISATFPLGWPEGSHGPVRRRPLEEFAFEDRWEAVASWGTDPPGVRHTQAGPPVRRSAQVQDNGGSE